MAVYLVTGGLGFIGSNFVREKLKNMSSEDRIIILDKITYAGNPDNLKEYLNDNIILPKKQKSWKQISWHIDLTTKSFDVSSIEDETIQKYVLRWSFKLAGYNYQSVETEKLTTVLEEQLQNHRLVLIVAGIEDEEVVGRIIPLVDYVVHFAAETHVDRSILNPTSFIEHDVFGTYNLLNAFKNSDRLKKFIHISTDEVYGPAPEGISYKEDTPLAPGNPYSASKVAADRMAYAFYNTYGLPVVIARPSNNYGPYQYPEKLIPVMIIKALNDEYLPVYGDGRQIRDWLYVKDTAWAIDVLIEKGKPGEVYNISGRSERENIYVIRKILKYLGKPESLIKHVKDRPGHDRRYSINDEKIRDLGWAPTGNLDDYISDVVKWYIDNRWWWEKILKYDREYTEFMQRWYRER